MTTIAVDAQLEVLNTISANDVAGSSCCIHLQHWFDYRGHVCIVFEKLGASLYDFMRKNGYRPFPLDVVQHFARQLLHAVAFLHSLNIVHTDLKPENVLLVNSEEYTKLDRERCGRLGCRVPLQSDIRVIDFGSATFEDERHSSLVSTRHYRAPEVRGLRPCRPATPATGWRARLLCCTPFQCGVSRHFGS
jgi:dual-specificity kinase